MGANASLLDHLPATERYFGFVNFGNTCYCNAVMQSLYFCTPFRNRVLSYKTKFSREPNVPQENMLTAIVDLFHYVATQNNKVGIFAPMKFITTLKKENELFNGHQQQDAMELYTSLLNDLAEKLSENIHTKPELTFVHELFGGVVISETKCVCCGEASKNEEAFLDLSLPIKENTTVQRCLRRFCGAEDIPTSTGAKCETCRCVQELQKRFLIKKYPNILALQLKRFEYNESENNMIKLSHNVEFPEELLLPPPENATGPHLKYNLVAVVVHSGDSPNSGHYISAVKSFGNWFVFDDDVIWHVDFAHVKKFYGTQSDNPGRHYTNTDTAYMLFYQSESKIN